MTELRDTPDLRAAAIAQKQHGIVTSAQLRAAGIDKDGVGFRVRAGRLHRVHRGVYSLSPTLSDRARWIAAVLACGSGAVLSPAAAAALWGLIGPLPGPIDVSVPTRNGRRKREGIRLHRCPSLTADTRDPEGFAVLLTIRDAIPVTTVPRTLEDLDGAVEPKLRRTAIREAEHRGHRLPGIETDGSRSDLETDFLALRRRHRLPHPEVNAEAAGLEVDFLWRAQRVVVETDDFTYHRGSVSFQLDHERDLKLRRAGYTVFRYTGDQLAAEAEAIVAELRAALGVAPYPSPGVRAGLANRS